jgi:hypothetical protein
MVDLECPVAPMNRIETKMKAMITTSQEQTKASQEEMKGAMWACQEKIQAS